MGSELVKDVCCVCVEFLRLVVKEVLDRLGECVNGVRGRVQLPYSITNLFIQMRSYT